MTTIERMIKEKEKRAYQRGFRDATRRYRAALRVVTKKVARAANGKTKRKSKAKKIHVSVRTRITAKAVAPPKPTRELREGSHPARVFEIIKLSAPMRSIDIVRGFKNQGHNERTTRTAINRLKKHHFIEKRGGRWFPLV